MQSIRVAEETGGLKPHQMRDSLRIATANREASRRESPLEKKPGKRNRVSAIIFTLKPKSLLRNPVSGFWDRGQSRKSTRFLNTPRKMPSRQ